jgi:hypothetical protein
LLSFEFFIEESLGFLIFAKLLGKPEILSNNYAITAQGLTK